MSLTAAAAAIVLLSLPGALGWWWDSSVTCTSYELCALKGSTVNFSCTYHPGHFLHYKYPALKVEDMYWTRGDSNENVKTDPEFANRVDYIFDNNDTGTIRISDLRENDQAQYRFIISNLTHSYSSPNISLSVTGLSVQTHNGYINYGYNSWAELECQSACSLPDNLIFIWYKNGIKVQENWPPLTAHIGYDDGDSVWCAVRGHEDLRSPLVYAPVVPSVTISVAPDDIVEGTALNLTCGGNNASVTINWYKTDGDDDELFTHYGNKLFTHSSVVYGNVDIRAVGRELVFESIKSSDSGKYYCSAESQLGSQSSDSIWVEVQYPPRSPSVSSSPSGDILEGTSMDLTCSSDANPAPTYTWYKGSQQVFQGRASIRVITSKYRRTYHCKAENKHGAINSSSLYINVVYAPKRPTVSIVPSGGITVGSTVTLTCSSDANPAASYAWFKENQDSPEAVGQTFIITRFTADHTGDYSCQATNSRGSHSISFQLTETGRPVFLTLNILKLMVVLLLAPLFVWRVRSGIKTIFISPQKKRRDSVGEMEFQPSLDYENMSPEQEALQRQRTVRELTLMLPARESRLEVR